MTLPCFNYLSGTQKDHIHAGYEQLCSLICSFWTWLQQRQVHLLDSQESLMNVKVTNSTLVARTVPITQHGQ
jgi:hypothetical protein